ncbi:MAG: hypothetical protein KGL39_51595 [Patescibacteria group bacterium]|nr:hypothetical protein [Patescibacteria group bacterium]
MLSYGGVQIDTASPELLLWCHQHLPWDRLLDFARPLPSSLALQTLGSWWQRRARPPRPGTLYWPGYDLSRPAVAYFFASDAQVALMPKSGLLTFDDGVRPSLSVTLWRLPVRRLHSNPSGNPNLITLVDLRFFLAQGGAISLTPGTTTWGQLCTSIATALGITFTQDAVNAAYLNPPADFAASYENGALLLDAACRAVGQRVVANLDGTYKAINSTTAQTLESQNKANVANFIAAGGDIITPADSLPGTFTVAFPEVDTVTGFAGNYYAVSNTFGNGPGGLTVKSTAVASVTSGVVTNATQLKALAAQATADALAWGSGDMDVAFSGIAAWNPTGFEDLEFLHTAQKILTRVQRAPWNERISVSPAYGSSGSLNVSNTFNNPVLNGPTIEGPVNIYPPVGGTNTNINVYAPSGGDTIFQYFGGPIQINGGDALTYWIFNLPLEICGVTFVCCQTVTQWTSNQNNWSDTTPATIYRVSSNADGIVLSGIAPFSINSVNQPQYVMLVNVGSHTIVLTNEDTNSTNVNRFTLPLDDHASGGAYTLAADDFVILWWDSCAGGTASRWRVISGTARFGASGASHGPGWVPDPGHTAGTTRFLREDATWQVPPDIDTACNSFTLNATTVNNYALPTLTCQFTEFNVTPDAGGTTLTGIVPQTITGGPVVITLINTATSDPLILSDNAGGSLAANRIFLPPVYGASVTLESNDTITLWYDSCAATPGWYVWACTVEAADLVMGASGPGHAAGDAPDPGAVAGTTRFLREDATWVAPTFTVPANYAGWVTVTKTFSDLAAASTSNTITLTTLAQKVVVTAIGLKHTVSFTGGGIAGYQISVGVTGSNNLFINAANVFQAVSDAAYASNQDTFNPTSKSFTSGNWDVTITAASQGANLNAATQGTVEVSLFVSTWF